MPDPQWLEDEKLTEAQLWEKRCREQLKRAQDAEAQYEGGTPALQGASVETGKGDRTHGRTSGAQLR